MSTAGVPEPWASRMRELGLVDPRFKDDVPSMSRLAEAADLHTSTVSSVIHGRRKASTETASALARVLGPEAQEWLGITVELGPYRPPVESAMLSSRQRRAVTELIRSMVVEDRADSEPRDPVEDATTPRTSSSSAQVGEVATHPAHAADELAHEQDTIADEQAAALDRPPKRGDAQGGAGSGSAARAHA